MKRLQTGVLTALAVVLGVGATQASAQNMRGFRVEAQTGYDSFSSEGNHHGKIGFGGAAGADFDLGGFVLGPEITYWRAFNENKTIEGGGLAERKSFQEWGLGLRAGVDVTPSTLVFGKVAYVRNEQRKRFTAIDSAGNLNDTLGYYYDHFKTSGWQFGGGVNQMLGGGFYASAEGRYSNYQNKHNLGGTHRVVGLIGLGYLFGAAAPEVAPPPPPPPPPPAPATQTCPDGTVIDAMAACPAPPPPPPPPPAPVERGERG